MENREIRQKSNDLIWQNDKARMKMNLLNDYGNNLDNEKPINSWNDEAYKATMRYENKDFILLKR